MKKSTLFILLITITLIIAINCANANRERKVIMYNKKGEIIKVYKVGDKATGLIFSYDEYARIEGLDEIKELEELWLTHNNLTKIEGLDNLKKLKKLDFYRNEITKIEGLDKLTELEELGLSMNQIKKSKV